MKLRVLGSILLIATVSLCVVAAAGAKSAAHGVRLLSPKNKAVIPSTRVSGKVPTFKARVRGKGWVYFSICKSKKRSSEGQLCKGKADEFSRGKKGKKTKKGRYYSYTPQVLTFVDYTFNTPGTYYWQVFRIDCVRKHNRKFDCIQESPLRKFTVK
jgi:hypothetical protein